MKFSARRLTRLTILFAAALLVRSPAGAQAVPAASADAAAQKRAEKTMSAVALILTGRGDGILDKFGSGVVVRPDGVILTTYRLVKDAAQVQVRLRNGEIFDRADLLGFDERRDVAALKIAAADLPAAEIRADEAPAGGGAFAASNPNGLGWTVAGGTLGAVRLADEIPNAGRGFRIVEFSASAAAGAGGLLTDADGRGVGLIVSAPAAGPGPGFAIPLSSVRGLADSPGKAMAFGAGGALEPPQPVRPPAALDVLKADPKSILRDAKIFHIASDSVLISEKMMENALMKRPEFASWKLAIVKEPRTADVLITVEHQLFTFDYRYTMIDRKTSIVLASGKVTVWDGKIASKKFAAKIIAALKEHKAAKTAAETPK